jgi:hypothetical protein
MYDRRFDMYRLLIGMIVMVSVLVNGVVVDDVVVRVDSSIGYMDVVDGDGVLVRWIDWDVDGCKKVWMYDDVVDCI